MNSPAVPTKRAAPTVLLLLLAACSPRAVESETLAPVPSATGTAPAGNTADARCEVPAEIFVAEDIRMYCAMPGDVQAFLTRESACQHFAGEEAYDEDRARELAYAIHETCDDRAALFNQLLQRHADNCLVHTELMLLGTRNELALDADSRAQPNPCPRGL
ncbi:hypothetical protein HMPREF3113_12290 [Stenotrophomonas sp. HMSC10F06]|nr:hypothetical protein HMPREF3113_12290 [Stenotrophomonas sp. HMSC10F06]